MMNEWLAQMYNTNGATEKVAEAAPQLENAELFAKLAAQHNIYLSEMTPEQIGELYGQVFPEETKVAEEEKKDEPKKEEKAEKDEEEKKESAAQYFQEKRAQQEKFAEADTMGRIMAHAFTQELENIKQASTKEAGKIGDIAKKFPGVEDLA